MSIDDTETPPVCGTCRFFHRGEIDPSTLKRDTRCREQLHVIAFPVGGPQGMGISVQTIYPHVPENWPACGRYVPVEEWQRQGEEGAV